MSESEKHPRRPSVHRRSIRLLGGTVGELVATGRRGRSLTIVATILVALLLVVLPLSQSIRVVAQGAATPVSETTPRARPTAAANWLNPGPATPHPLGSVIPPEVSENASDWPAPAGTLAGTRANLHAAIDSSNVAQLSLAWTFPVTAPGSYGGMTGVHAHRR